MEKKYKRLKTIEYRFCEKRFVYPELTGGKITDPEMLFDQIRVFFENTLVEKFYVFWLSTANKITGYELVSQGTLSESIVHPREVFRGAIIASCKSVVLAHNHPSNDLQPSKDDQEITKRLRESGKLLNIPVLDHLIIGENNYYSFMGEGLL